MISFLSGLSSDSSILTWRRSLLPDSLTVSMPPPAVPSTSMRSSSACMFSILDLSSVACFIRPRKSGIVVTLTIWRHVVGIGYRCAGRRTHLDDLCAGETGQHGLHQRIAAHVVFQFGLAAFSLGPQRRFAGFGGDRHHPAPAGPFGKLFCKVIDQGSGGARLKRDF